MKAENSMRKFKLGIALSGGGARGFAHLGALKAMNERKLYPEIISGTSAGSLAGVLYADGYSPDEIFTFFKSLSFSNFAEVSIPEGGFLKTTKIQTFLKKHLRAKTFEELKIPLKVIASDIELGESRIFSEGELIQPIVASCSVPIVFSPMEIDGHFYVDGGLFMNFPVSVIRKDCIKVIGVDVSPVIPMKYDKSLKYMIERSMNYMVGANSALERCHCDYLIESKSISQYSIFDLKHADIIYKKGYELACDYLESNKSAIERDFFKRDWVPKTPLGRLLKSFKRG